MILRGVGGLYAVCRTAGDDITQCVARGIFRKHGMKPLPGDSVEFEPDPHQEGHGTIVAILKRKTELSRPAVANATQLLVIVSRAEPEPDFLFVDKLAACALAAGVKPAVFVSKPDLAARADFDAEIDGYALAGFSAIRADTAPAEATPGLMGLLNGQVTVFAGQSGVGKSTLMNAVLGRELMPVGEISRRIRRGKNTTRHAELAPLAGGGYIVDTPGFSALEGDGASQPNYDWRPAELREAAGRLSGYYPELAPYEGQCRFAGCSHVHEPGCAAIAAVAAGELHPGRHARYAELARQLSAARSRN